MSTLNTSAWTGTYGSYSRKFRGYMTYTWEPNYSNTQSKLTISAIGVEKTTSGATTWVNGGANASISMTGQTVQHLSRDLSDDPITFDSSANSKKKLWTISSPLTFYWSRGYADATKTLEFVLGKTGSAWAGDGAGGLSLSVPAKQKYAVTYNANGGSGAPSAQTKWYGETLTLSGTKPTRAGYTFLRWSTNAAGTGTNYSPGTAYTANVALTLYAIWQINTYTVAYNANGGSGSITSQTKTHGTALTLNNGANFTRQYYELTGWNTAANGSGTAYALSGSYTANANATMYAQWHLAYVKPMITDFTAYRTDTNATSEESDDGRCIRLSFGYACGEYQGSAVETTCLIEIDGIEVYNDTLPAASGTFTRYFSPYDESAHTVYVKIYDSHDSTGTVVTTQIATATFPLDFLIGSNDELCMGIMTPAVDGQPLTLAGIVSNGEIIDGHGIVMSEIAGGSTLQTISNSEINALMAT